MDLVNDLSSDLALAVLVDGPLRDKLGSVDAKSFIELVEHELQRISSQAATTYPDLTPQTFQASLSH